jgi:hypothetical protein
MTGMQPKYTVEKIAAVVGLAYRMQLLEDLATASGPYTAFATASHQRGRIR